MIDLIVPVNASAIPADQRGQTRVRVAIRRGNDIQSEIVSVTGGQAEARFSVAADGPITVAVGPEAAADADLFNRATPTLTVSPRATQGLDRYVVSPIVVTAPIWRNWLFWCRNFTITGTVLGTDGNPVPAASVSAFDVERLWWWSSTTQVGATAITNAAGQFTISFEWCCGWLPWYWWAVRFWRLDPCLIERINPVLALNPNLRMAAPSVFPRLGFTMLNPQPEPPGRRSRVIDAFNPQPDPPGRSGPRSVVSAMALNPGTLPALGQKLRAVLPSVPEFERLCLWPWCDELPWFNCEPDIIFRVTQACGGVTNTIVNETACDARIDIPTAFSLTLTAAADACTIPPDPGQPEGDCFVFTYVCDVPTASVGLVCDTSMPAPAPPGALNPLAGLADPGGEDRPFTGTVVLNGQFGSSAQADYYEITYRPLQPCSLPGSTTPFQPMPAGALGAFQRTYFDATQPYPNQWFFPSFVPTSMAVSGGGTATVYESRHFYEEANAPANWGNVMSGRSWTGNVDVVAVIYPVGYLADGVYEFQIVGYTEGAGGITRVGPLIGCGQPSAQGLNDNNDIAVYLANPTAAEVEPDASIDGLTFTVNGVQQALPPCGILQVPFGAAIGLAIQFTAADAQGFLDAYGFTLQSGSALPVGIAMAATGPVPPGTGLLASLTAGAEIGPDYAHAVTQGAARPHWSGGSYTLTIADASSLFYRSCAYELALSVFKRNIVSCDGDDPYWRPAYYSFTVLYQ